MKKYFIPAFIALILSMVSCNSKDEESVGSMFSGFVTAYTDGNGLISMVKDDMGNEYAITGCSDVLIPDTIYRYVVSMGLDENSTAHIIQKVTPLYGAVKAPETSILSDTLKKQDPVQINAAYIGGGFLNITMGIKIQQDSKMHSLLYARMSDEDQLTFTVYHDAHGDTPMYTMYAYLSIPLKDYGISRNDTVFLKCKGYQEDCNMKLIYR